MHLLHVCVRFGSLGFGHDSPDRALHVGARDEVRLADRAAKCATCVKLEQKDVSQTHTTELVSKVR